MAKISEGDLKIALGWKAFFDRLSWKYHDCDTVGGTARRETDTIRLDKDGKSKALLREITMAERIDIERTWREQDKPEIKAVSNG